MYIAHASGAYTGLALLISSIWSALINPHDV